MISTRDTKKQPKSYTDVLLQGLAPDGGLYVPSEYQAFSLEEIKEMQNLPFTEIVLAVKQKLLGGAIPIDVLKQLINKAYSTDKFIGTKNGNTVPLMKVLDNFYVQNLSLGPTASLKDIALQLLGQEMNYELNKRDEELTILGATSGDTGSSAEAAFKGLERVKLFILSPEEGMSKFQKAQMGSLTGDNIFNISVRGRFDDCQDLVKELKQDPEFAKLGTVNSINWGRISSQIPYFFSGYLQACTYNKNIADNVGDETSFSGTEVDFVVPTGNFGNVLSGYIAKKMGLPIRRLIVATNENDVLDKLFKTGIYELTPAQVTSSPSMDISKASNYERLVFDIFGGDANKVVNYMQEFTQKGSVDLKDYGLSKDVFTEIGFHSDKSTHADRMRAIKEVYEKAGFVIDTHTADAVAVGLKKYDEKQTVPTICMGTALPVKFEDSIEEALGFVPERPERFVGLEDNMQDDAFHIIDIDAKQLKNYIRKNI